MAVRAEKSNSRGGLSKSVKQATTPTWLLELAGLLSEEEGAALEKAVMERRTEQRELARKRGAGW